MANCPFCGVEVQEGVKFCTSCGASLESAEPIGNGPAPAQAAPVETPAQQAVPEQPYQQQYQQPQPAQAAPAQAAPAQAAPVDSGSIGWAILGFIIPLAGIILFLVWRTTKPQTAKMAAIGAAAGFLLALIVNVLTNMNI